MNKVLMRRFHYIACTMMAAMMLVATSCSEFDDYNDAPSDATASGNMTLWQNITQNPQLSDFASLVKRTRFDVELDNTRAYTVWAPLNGTFNVGAYQQLDDSTLLAQFVKSHVAQYNHVASGSIDERIHTLNKKSFPVTGNGDYTYDGVHISAPNQPSSNGVMHLMDGAAQFFPNLYEYLSMGQGIDSLRNYFLGYELTTLDLQNSVKGSVVGGVQTYIDSVLITTNSLTRQLNASLDNEDSTYTFIMPTDKAYQQMYDKVKQNYNFIATTKVQDVEQFASASATNSKNVTVNAEYLSDSLTRRHIVRNLIFSNNDGYNRWVVGKGLFSDTLRSTTRNKLSNPNDILAQTIEKVEMSNGFAHIVDSLAFYPWETFAPEIEVSPSRHVANKFNCSSQNVTFTDPEGRVFGPEIKEFRYTWIYPTSEYSKPDVFISLPNVNSTTYNFYCVFLPSAYVANDSLPNILNFQLSYCAANGNLATYNFSKAYADSLLTGGTLPRVPSSVSMTTAFTNDPLKTDTVFIGRFQFPVAYNGLGDEYRPNIHISNPISVFNKTQMSTYTRDMRIAAIIMRPVEMDEFEKEQ